MQPKKNILITGSNSEPGKAAAKKFRENGWTVSYVRCDVTDRDALIREVAQMEESGIHFDALLTAGLKEISTGFEETDIEEWEKLLKSWLGGAANACKAVTPHMIGRKSGSIMLLCPDYRNDKSDCIMNAAASGTLHGFAKSFGTEVASEGVRVNVLWPSLPFDHEAIADMAFYLADVDEYTAAQVISITGDEQEAF